MLAKTEWNASEEPEWFEPGFYWTPATAAATDEVHPRLLQAIADRSGVELHTAALYECDTGAPVGFLDLAVDAVTDEACAVYHECYEGENGEGCTEAVWFPMQPTADLAVEMLVDGLQRRARIKACNKLKGLFICL